jgi:glyoxylase-like metal-dependent hydrolase (beta-lactamase superfamily II)
MKTFIQLVRAAGLVCILACAGFAAHAEQPNRPSPEIKQIRVGTANVFVVKSDPLVLIDTGDKKDLVALLDGLKTEGISVAQIKTIVLTHGHADHSGSAAELRRRSGAILVAGAADSVMTKAGHNDDIKPTNFMAKVLKRFAIDPSYEPFEADLKVGAPIDLKRFGIAGKMVQMPGHTPGSLVLILDDGRAFVGDMMLGGWMGGAVFANRAGEHYFQDDLVRNHANIAELLKLPIHTFYLGHGGPVSRASVLEGFGLADPLLISAGPN